MHGRVKTISTEEQKEKQKKARDVKLQLYKETMGRITAKRSNLEYDDEALNLTKDMLIANPDIITLWHYRREIFQFKKGSCNDAKEYDEMLKADLSLTELCLRVNPKSYGTWHYRIWLIENMSEDLWSQEIALCNKYLSMDERNFHCWQYRNVVAKYANIPYLDEYQFTTEKIESNFSNYSAWHYRSKLLPRIFEDPNEKFPIAEEKHKNELELVQNAAFTDPDDQSAWFYLRWLLDLRRPPISVVAAFVDTELKSLFVAFSRDIPPKTELKVEIDGSAARGVWKTPSNSITSAMWRFKFQTHVADEANIEIILPSENNFENTDGIQLTVTRPFTKAPCFTPSYSNALKQAFEEQLKNCQELLKLEPESKWTLLTCVFAMKSIDLLTYQTPIIEMLEKLSQVDSMRSGYYKDLQSQVEIESELLKNAFAETFNRSNCNLTRLCHIPYLILCKKINLSGNKLTSVNLSSLRYLVSCEELDLTNNLLETLETLPLMNNLQTLLFNKNPITSLKKTLIHLRKYPKLFEITFKWCPT